MQLKFKSSSTKLQAFMIDTSMESMMRGMDRLQEINRNLIHSHLVYLQTDESPQKLQQRQKLEGFIREYLYLVPHDTKFEYQETAHILHRSAASMQDFSGYRGCSAWTAISLYASNLLAQPWRKEYRTLRTYSGFYKHEIEANLIGAELMLELMGYKHTGLGVLTLEGPIDPDKVSCVSKDAIVAFVECQIMKQIWEEVSQTYTVTWLEILEFRERHVGTPEQAIRALNHRYFERVQQNRPKLDVYRDCHYGQPTIIDTVRPMAPYHADYGCSDDNFHYFIPVEPQYNPYGCLPKNNRFYGAALHSNSPYFVNALPNYTVRMPTARLIDMDSTPEPLVVYDKPKHRRSTTTAVRSIEDVDYHHPGHFDDDYVKSETRKPMKTSTSLDSAQHESWDYVYRSLNGLGYSKDVGEREDILRKAENKDSKVRQPRELITEYEDQFSSRKFERKRDKDSGITNHTGKNKTVVDLIEINGSNVDFKGQYATQDKVVKGYQPKSCQDVVDLVKSMSITDENQHVDEVEKWNCSVCTFLNLPGKDICEMCSKSRQKGDEDRPLASGGRECPQCTLVNTKDASKCEACNESLKDSPTYI